MGQNEKNLVRADIFLFAHKLRCCSIRPAFRNCANWREGDLATDGWLDQLQDDAEFNIASYVDCFLSENLARRYIAERKIALLQGVKREVDDWRAAES